MCSVCYSHNVCVWCMCVICIVLCGIHLAYACCVCFVYFVCMYCVLHVWYVCSIYCVFNCVFYITGVFVRVVYLCYIYYWHVMYFCGMCFYMGKSVVCIWYMNNVCLLWYMNGVCVCVSEVYCVCGMFLVWCIVG